MATSAPTSGAVDAQQFAAFVQQLGGVQGAKTATPPPSSDRSRVVAFAYQTAQKYGIDPVVFLRMGQQESGFRGGAVSPAGASGDYQVVQAAHPTAPTERLARIDYAGKFLSDLLRQYNGDYRLALAAYNAGPGAVQRYGGVPPFEETKRYLDNILNGKNEAYVAPQEINQAAAATGQRAQPSGRGRDLAPDQFNSNGELTADQAGAACGVAASLAFARANGRNPTWPEAMALAKQAGWTPQGGMNGVQNELALLTKLGVPARLDTAVNPDAIAKDASNGNPVAISTGAHYYVATGYDPATGKLYVGVTGKNRLGGSEWMSVQDIQALDHEYGGINGVLYADHPSSANASVAARSDAGVDTSGRDDYRLDTPKADAVAPDTTAAPPVLIEPQETPAEKQAKENDRQASLVKPFQPPQDRAPSPLPGFQAPEPGPFDQETDPEADLWSIPMRGAR